VLWFGCQVWWEAAGLPLISITSEIYLPIWEHSSPNSDLLLMSAMRFLFTHCAPLNHALFHYCVLLVQPLQCIPQKTSIFNSSSFDDCAEPTSLSDTPSSDSLEDCSLWSVALAASTTGTGTLKFPSGPRGIAPRWFGGLRAQFLGNWWRAHSCFSMRSASFFLETMPLTFR